jgi:hypothetical protein
VALEDLQTPSSGVSPVVFLDIAGKSTWSETLMIIANAFCLDSSGAPNRSAANLALLPLPAIAAPSIQPRKATN